jgi:hypothetical protein
MVDVGTHHFVKAGTGEHSVLVPQPSDDPHDPLVSSQIDCHGSYSTDGLLELESHVERICNDMCNSGSVFSRDGPSGTGMSSAITLQTGS